MDYKALGLVAGIEIHQQLDTAEKLFCHCPTALRETAEHSGEFCRYLRATVSEMGEIDRAAQEEMKHDRLFHYYTYDTTCLVENDEEPPAPVNDEALAVAAVDLSGRPHAVVQTGVRARLVGDLQSELVADFFDGFAMGARANVHVKVLYGRSNHHRIEAVFKAFGRALRVACARDRQLAKMLPSTKGLL